MTTTDIDPDAATRALTGAFERMIEAAGEGWTQREGGAQASVTGVEVPTLNGVWVEDLAADPEAVGVMLERLRATGLPHCLQIRPGSGPAFAELARQLAMARIEDIPLMVLDMGDPREFPKAPAGLQIRRIDPAQARLHADLAAAGFEAPVEHFRRLMTPAILAGPGTRCYVGELGGEAVTTGLGSSFDGAVGIFNIATPPRFRRRGYGAAVTARAVEDGVVAGARWAWLQSSPLGFTVYERLGFRTIETWECWITPPPAG